MNGLSGKLLLFWPSINQSQWIGGQYDNDGNGGAERLPYWLNGFVPLVTLNINSNNNNNMNNNMNDEYLKQVENVIFYILAHQESDGWLGPNNSNITDGPGNLYWQGYNIIRSLLQYADWNTTATQQIHQTVIKYMFATYKRMQKYPLTLWSQIRSYDLINIVHDVIDRVSIEYKDELLKLAELAAQQSYNWSNYYHKEFPKHGVNEWTMKDHGVNNAQALKGPSVLFRQEQQMQQNNMQAQDETDFMLYMQDTYHGQPYGLFAADECFGGKNLSRGIELCAIVEQMFSLSVIFQNIGGVQYMDRLEKIAYNALPGALTADLWEHNYLSQANEIFAGETQNHVWVTDGVNSTIYGLAPNFGCCTANFNQGFPKLVYNSVLEKKNNSELESIIVASFTPVIAQLSVGNIILNTNYPFSSIININMNVNISKVVLEIRIPEWCEYPQLNVNDQEPIIIKENGIMYPISLLNGNNKIKLDLKTKLRIIGNYGIDANAISVMYGSLLFGLHLNEERKILAQYSFESRDYQISTQNPWNYALLINQSNPLSSFHIEFHDLSPIQPFSHQTFPITIKVKAKQLLSWNIYKSAASNPPLSPINCNQVQCSTKIEEVTLVPYGNTGLRIAAFPFIHYN